MRKILAAMGICLTLTVTSAKADMFSLHLTQAASGIDELRQFKSVEDIFDHYKDGDLKSLFSNYDNTKASVGLLDFRGIMMRLSFSASTITPGVDSKLTFDAPSVGVTGLTFDGGSQEESFKLLRDYLKNNRDGLLKKVLKASVADTPYDAVAGNPGSLMATMVDSSYQRGGGGVMGNFVSYLAPDAAVHHFKINGETKEAKVLSLPMGKTFQFDNGAALLFDLPLAYTDWEGSKSYSAQLGMGLKIPLVQNDSIQWNLTPSARAGVVGSTDMLSGGVLYFGGLTNYIKVPLGSAVNISMTNMAGYIRDMGVKVAGYEVEYDLKNMVFKNGASADWQFANKWYIGAGYSYTFYSGSDLYVDKYHEVSTSLTRQFEKDSFFSGVALVGKYVFDRDHYYAYRAGINFLF